LARSILGISAYYHDSAAALLVDGNLIAAAQEERFTRKKHDNRFPKNSVEYCLNEGGIKFKDLEAVVFYDKPLIKFDRLLETYLSYAPKGIRSFSMAMPIWLKEKLLLKSTLKKELGDLAGIAQKEMPRILFTEHHQSHAASAYYPSPFETAAVLCMDGVGEWATTSVWLGEGNRLTPQWELRFPHSLGMLYSAFTYYTGFKVNSGEYKIMGLAPYGEPKYVDLILRHLLDLKSDGTFRLNMKYFNYPVGLTMTNSKFDTLFGGPARKPESIVTQKEMDLARSIQEVTEKVVLRLARTIQKETNAKHLCLAGGVALNCVANGRLLREGPFEDIWIQPAAGDAGGAVGAAYAGWHQYFDQKRIPNKSDSMQGGYLGPMIQNNDAKAELDRLGAVYHFYSDNELLDKLVPLLEQGMVLGCHRGRMEFGPRALGNRSILGDARNIKMQATMNLKIKYRESFRPFAPAVLEEDVSDFFETNQASPYMLLVAPVVKRRQIKMDPAQQTLFGIDKLNVPRSDIPAVTHIDYSARIQTVNKETNPFFHSLLSAFKKKTGCSVLVNTSFNVRGEPIVCTVEDAYRCFMRTELDCLLVGNYLLQKTEQPLSVQDETWKMEFVLD